MVACSEHRSGLMLLAIKMKLAEDDLDREERVRLEADLERLERELDMD